MDGRIFLLKQRQMNKEKLESTKNLFFIALGLDIAVTVLVVISDFWGVGVLNDIGTGRVTADQSTISTLEFWDSFAKLMLLTMLGVGLGLVKWLNACYSFAKESIGASGFKNEGWTTGGWIIPIFNLFKPYQVINEIYKAGSPTYAAPDGWKKESGSGLLLAWWIFWAVTHFIGWIVGRQMFKSAMRDEMTLQQSIGAIEFHAWFCVVFLVVSGLWLVVANELTRRLLERKTVEGRSLQRGHSAAAASDTPQIHKAVALETTGAEAKISSSKVSVSVIPESTQITQEEENAIYAAVAGELESGNTDKGLWTRLYAECDGDEKKIKVQYIKNRVNQWIDVERAKREVEKDTAKKAAEAIALEQQSIEESNRLAYLKAERLLSEERVKLKEAEALATFGIEKEEMQYHFHGHSYDYLDDAIAYAKRVQTGNPWATLSADASSSTNNSVVRFLGVKIFLGVAVFLAIIFAIFIGLANHSESRKMQGSEFTSVPTPPSYSPTDKFVCLQLENPSVADLCSMHAAANDFCKNVILSVLESKGYPSLIQGCSRHKPANAAVSQ